MVATQTFLEFGKPRNLGKMFSHFDLLRIFFKWVGETTTNHVMNFLHGFMDPLMINSHLLDQVYWGTDPAGRLYAPVWCQQSHWSRWGMLWWTRDAWKCLGSTMDPTLPIILAWQWMSAMVVTWGGTKKQQKCRFFIDSIFVLSLSEGFLK